MLLTAYKNRREVVGTCDANDTMSRWSKQLLLAAENGHFEGSMLPKEMQCVMSPFCQRGVFFDQQNLVVEIVQSPKIPENRFSKNESRTLPQCFYGHCDVTNMISKSFAPVVHSETCPKGEGEEGIVSGFCQGGVTFPPTKFWTLDIFHYQIF